MKDIVITIDGPAGAGKTTISRILADRLGFRYVDTGALYRGVAWAAAENLVDPADDAALARMLETLSLTFVRHTDGSTALLAGGVDITGKIRTPEISMAASVVSAMPCVRAYLLSVQRQLGAEKRAIFEGRDMGTVVFPEAEVKFFLEADDTIRAKRRHKELSGAAGQSYEAVLADIRKRDANDTGRALAPLTPAADAIRIDSTSLGIEGVVDRMLAHVTERCNL